jgi:hypothetical protein
MCKNNKLHNQKRQQKFEKEEQKSRIKRWYE